MFNKIYFGRRGQVGETLTWVIATIIIVVILIFFIFGANALGSTKRVGHFKPSLLSVEIEVGDDQFLKKSLFTYVKVEDISTKNLINANLLESDKFDISYKDTRKEIVRRYESGKD